MANYLLSRRSVQTPRGVTGLLSALTTLANSDFQKPICVTLENEEVSISVQQPFVTVKVCDILGNPLISTFKVIANRATRVGDDVVIFSKQSFQPSPTEKWVWTRLSSDLSPILYRLGLLFLPVGYTLGDSIRWHNPLTFRYNLRKGSRSSTDTILYSLIYILYELEYIKHLKHIFRTLFTMNIMDTKPERGFYKISVAAGTVMSTIVVKVLCDVSIDHMEIGTADADQTTQPKLTR